MPRWWPNCVSASSVSADTSLTMPPMRHAVAMSDAVLPSIAEKYDSCVAVRVEQVLQLEHLTAAQLADRVGEQPRDVGAERCGERRRLREQEVAREDRDDVRPARVHARHAAPGLGLVDHVVVVERPEVHELDRGRAGDGVGRGRGVAAYGRVGGSRG